MDKAVAHVQGPKLPEAMTTLEKWRGYWSNRTSPEHASDSPEFYRFYAREVRLLMGDKPLRRILEIGCGNGALYPYFGFDQTQYRGVDFSPSMLATFRAKHPELDLVLAEGSSYAEPGNKYDLIFSDQVIQLFDRAMLDRHFACARTMMDGVSLFICASIPWKPMRLRYFAGQIPGTKINKIVRLIPFLVQASLWGDPVGYWYRLRDIENLAQRHGFSVKFYGSMVYHHAFHAVMKLRDSFVPR